MPFNAEEVILELEQVKPIKKFFTNFFPTRNTHLTEELKVQVKKGKIKMAPFVAPRVGGVIMARQGWRSFSVTPPRISIDKPITIDDLMKKTLGETVISTLTPAERALKLLADDLNESMASIEGRIEWMCRQIMLTGNINVEDIESGVDVNIDYNFTNVIELSTGATWDSDDANPLDDILELRESIVTKSGVNPNNCILGRKARKAFLNNKKVREELDIRRISRGEITIRLIDEALTFIGEIDGVQYYSYIESFLNDNNEEEQMMPENKVLLTAAVNGSVEFGAVTYVNDNKDYETYASEFVPKEIVDVDNDIKKLRLTSKPIPVPFDVDSWGVITVVDEDYEG